MRKSIQCFLIGAYIFLVGICFYLLATSQSGDSILSPWQTIRHSYIYVFGIATLILGLLAWFSNLKPSIILIFFILHSLLLHSYLPLTHTLLYGADQWRHIASEMRIVQGLPFIDAATHSVPSLAAFVGQISYSSLWYISIAKAFGVQLFTHWDTLTSLIFVSKWLQVIWWSLTVPVLLYFVGKVLGWSNKQSLLLSWLGFLPFPFQYGGSVLVPVHFGFPIFLLGIILHMQRLKSDDKKWLKWLLFIGFLMVFGYLLYAVLFWVGWVTCEIVRKFKILDFRFKNAILFLCFIFITVSLPLLEYVGHYTNLKSEILNLKSLHDIIVNFTLLDVARGTSLDYLNGNIIFNQVPNYAFVSNIFTIWRWWLPVFIVAFWIVCVFGLRALWRRGDVVGKWLVIFGTGLFANYIVSRYFLSGEQILTRRLDTTLALFFLIYFATGLVHLAKNTPPFIPPLKGEGQGVGLFPIIFLMSFAITVAYSLGPDTQTVSANEFRAMQQVWTAEKSEMNHCVIADTYPLLALEAISAKRIVGGGFPINQYFAQPELSHIRSIMKSGDANMSAPAMDALQITQAKDCWFVNGSGAFRLSEE